MININLLPWREKKRHQQKEATKIISIAESIIALLIILIYLFLFGSKAETYRSEQVILSKEINSINNEIISLSHTPNKRSELEQKMVALNHLKKNRLNALNVLTAAAAAIPKTIKINKLVIEEDEITIVGNSPNNENITAYINNINSLNNFHMAKLKESKIVDDDGEQTLYFQINFKFIHQTILKKMDKKDAPEKK